MTIQRMPPVVIPLGQGPDESTARLFRDPTRVLADVRQGDVSKPPGLRKARGFTRIALTTTTHGETPEAVYVSVAVDHLGELVLVGRDNVYGVAAPSASVDGAALVLRGPSLVGTFEIGMVHSGAIGRET